MTQVLLTIKSETHRKLSENSAVLKKQRNNRQGLESVCNHRYANKKDTGEPQAEKMSDKSVLCPNSFTNTPIPAFSAIQKASCKNTFVL